MAGPTPSTSTGRPVLNLDTSPKLNPPTYGVSGGQSPDKSPVVASPEGGEDSPSPTAAGPALMLGGDTTHTANFLAVRDPNNLSSGDFVVHHNQGLFFGILDRQAKAMEAMARLKSFTPTAEPKIGSATPEELATIGVMHKEYTDLIRDVLDTYGKSLKPTQLTSRPGLKLNEQAVEFQTRLIAAAPVSEDGTGKTRVQQLFDELSEAGVRIFFRNMVNTFTPQAAGKKSRAAATPVGPTFSDEDQLIVDSITGEPLSTVLVAAFIKYINSLSTTPLTTTVKGLAQAKNLVEAMRAEASEDNDDDEEMDEDAPVSDLQKIANNMVLLTDDGLLALWTSLLKEHKPAAKKSSGKKPAAESAKAGGKRTRAAAGGEEEEEGEEDDAQAVEGGSPKKKAKAKGRGRPRKDGL